MNDLEKMADATAQKLGYLVQAGESTLSKSQFIILDALTTAYNSGKVEGVEQSKQRVTELESVLGEARDALKNVDCITRELLKEHGGKMIGATDWLIVNDGLVQCGHAQTKLEKTLGEGKQP